MQRFSFLFIRWTGVVALMALSVATPVAATSPVEAAPEAAETSEPEVQVFAVEAFELLQVDMLIAERAELDRERPRLAKGDEVSIHLNKGGLENGLFVWSSGDRCFITKDGEEEAVVYQSISALDRLCCDFDFRQDWTRLQTAVQTRKLLEESWAELELTPEEKAEAYTFEKTLAHVDPEALVARGMKYLDPNAEDNDPGYAFMNIHFAASQGNTDALYRLGNLYLRGLGIAKNPSRGLHYISSAANQQHPGAQAFLVKYRQQLETQKRAMADYARRLKERERSEAQRRNVKRVAAYNNPVMRKMNRFPTQSGKSSGGVKRSSSRDKNSSRDRNSSRY